MQSAADLFRKASDVLKSIPPRKRKQYDGIEVVFVDVVNGHPKSNRSYTFDEIMEALELDSKPIGLILMHWDDPEKMAVEEFPGITTAEQESLMHAFAEAQDQAKEINNEEF